MQERKIWQSQRHRIGRKKKKKVYLPIPSNISVTCQVTVNQSILPFKNIYIKQRKKKIDVNQTLRRKPHCGKTSIYPSPRFTISFFSSGTTDTKRPSVQTPTLQTLQKDRQLYTHRNEPFTPNYSLFCFKRVEHTF